MVERDGMLLLGKRGKEPAYGTMITPGGGVEQFESIADTARREIREETGLEITNLRQFDAYQIIRPETGEHRIVIYWKADWKSGEPAPSSDLLTAKFHTREEIKAEFDAGNITGIMEEVLTAAGWL